MEEQGHWHGMILCRIPVAPSMIDVLNWQCRQFLLITFIKVKSVPGFNFEYLV